MDIIHNGEISISPEQWVELNENKSRDEIKQLISDAMDGLDLPYRKIEADEADQEFQRLKEFDGLSLFRNGEWFSRYDYRYKLTDTYIDMCNVGNKASDYFLQQHRWRCDSINSPSPYRTWTQERFRLTLLNALWTLKVKEVNSKTLRSCISLRKYIAAQFKPSVAKAVYQHFDAKRVLDFSSGWGDRLVAFQATDSVEKYHGVDPNINLKHPYEQMVSQYGYAGEYTQEWMPAEEAAIGGTYDLVFTSPPYFNIERYTQEQNQSWKRYKKIDVWLNEFLFRTLRKSWNALERGGHLAINISDVYSNHTVNHICDPMNDFIRGLPRAKYMGAMGMRMAKRPNSASQKEGIFCEPIWVWEKG